MGNTSNKISEATMAACQLFKKYDTNHSNYLELNEIENMIIRESHNSTLPLTSCPRNYINRLVALLDSNQDGIISKEELI